MQEDGPTDEVMEVLTKVSSSPVSGTVLITVVFSKSEMIYNRFLL